VPLISISLEVPAGIAFRHRPVAGEQLVELRQLRVNVLGVAQHHRDLLDVFGGWDPRGTAGRGPVAGSPSF